LIYISRPCLGGGVRADVLIGLDLRDEHCIQTDKRRDTRSGNSINDFANEYLHRQELKLGTPMKGSDGKAMKVLFYPGVILEFKVCVPNCPCEFIHVKVIYVGLWVFNTAKPTGRNRGRTCIFTNCLGGERE
jgi:hypothetical protein